MAGIIHIKSTRSGGISQSLLVHSELYLNRDGWAMAVANERAEGGYDDTVEVIECTWRELEDDSRGQTLKNIMALDQDARRHWRDFSRRWPVYLEASTHSEPATRYAVIKKIEIGNLDPRHWGPDQPVKLTLTITHIGWRDIAPFAVQDVLSIGGAKRVYNQVDGSKDNWVRIGAGQTGRMGPLTIEIVPDKTVTPTPRNYRIAIKEEVSGFNPHFNAADEIIQSKTADSDAPGGQRIQITGPLNDSMMWQIDAADYVGNYAVYAIARASGGSGVRLAFLNGGTVALHPWVNVPSSSLFREIYLGSITIPWFGNVPNATLPNNYEPTILFEVPDSRTLYFYNFYLLPLDDNVMTISSNTTETIIIDGDMERTYAKATSGGALLTEYQIEVSGKYFQGWGGVLRMYFFSTHDDVGANEFNIVSAKHEMDVTVRGVKMFSALKGS
jgi:hypothetical protein